MTPVQEQEHEKTFSHASASVQKQSELDKSFRPIADPIQKAFMEDNKQFGQPSNEDTDKKKSGFFSNFGKNLSTSNDRKIANEPFAQSSDVAGISKYAQDKRSNLNTVELECDPMLQ